MTKIKISAVAYTNTKPFIYGLQHNGVADQIDLSLDIPSDCANKLINGQVDIGLIPVATLPLVPNGHIIADYGIGANGEVNSVFIFSKKPINEIRTLKLDSHSRTSNNLARVLLKNYWKQEVELLTEGEADAFVLIGDRTFGQKEKHAYAYDMGKEWKSFTGLPFLFAAWVANKPIPEAFVAEFNAALKFGLDNREALLQELEMQTDIDLRDYLLHKLDFNLNDKKREALTLFLDLISKLEDK